MLASSWGRSILALGGVLLLASASRAQSGWPGYAADDQHAANAPVAAQSLQQIHWSTPVDLALQFDGSDLLIHYGTPLITPANTVIVTVKVGAQGNFQIEGHRGTDGALEWFQTTDYQLPPHRWIPSCAGTLTPQNVLYIPGAGGTLYYRLNPDTQYRPSPVRPLPTPSPHAAPHPRVIATPQPVVGQIAFYGTSQYQANRQAYNSTVFINTPITSDSQGNLYFGFYCASGTPQNLKSGIARISASGVGSWIAAGQAAGDNTITKVAHNCAPALSQDGTILYVAVNSGSGKGATGGYLLALDSGTLATLGKVRLKDALSGKDAYVDDDGTSSPTVGPDGDVYYGVLENPLYSNHLRGWLLHFDRLLMTAKTPGAFGWDDTASVVPAAAVPSYTGTSAYLLLTKYNNYVEGGGDGVNRVAVLDPNAGETDPISGAAVMQEILTIAGPTPDTEFTAQHPNAVREWCINSAVIDPFTKCALVNNEDGVLYRWDFTTNTLTEKVVLTSGVGEAYTPTLVGPDRMVYAINDATLFAVGK